MNDRKRDPPADGGGSGAGRDPSLLVWLVASISLVLPWIAAGSCLWGAVLLAGGDGTGWLLIGAGLAGFVLDVAIDFAWARPSVMTSDDPDLNRRGARLVGRLALVAEPIDGGRGKVRLGDTLWTAEGPDAPVGATVRVRATRDTVLAVEPPEGTARDG